MIGQKAPVPRRLSLLVAFFAASTSGLALLIYAAGWVTLPWSVTFLAPLTVLLLAALLVRAGKGEEDVLRTRLIGGAMAGVAGLIAYNISRALILWSGLVPFNPFRPIEVYGLLILNEVQDSLLTRVVGWSFHIWNGLSFAIMYAVAVGPGRVWKAVAWALMLELAMIATYPTIFHIVLDWPFVTVSLLGHLFYGVGVGMAAERAVKC